MKRLSYLMSVLLILVLASCSSSDAPKEIKPTSTEFTSGELAKLIEVVDESCQLSYAEKDGVIASQFIKLKVKLKLTKESPELQKCDARDIKFTGLLSVAIVNLVDENDTKVQDLNVKSEDLLKLKKLLQGKRGDEETITFEEEFHNSKDAPKWFEQTSAFTPYITGDVVVDNEIIPSVSGSFEIDGTHDMYGTVDKYPITMHLEIDGSSVKGTYYYDKQGDNAKLKLSGTNEDGILDLNETDADGTPTGHFRGKISNGVFKGMFITNQGKKMSFEVSEDGINGGDFSIDSDENEDLNDISLEDDDFTTGDGDPSIDAYIDEYERYVKEFIKTMKKIDKSDPAAMLEYSKLINRAQQFDEKFRKVRGKMSMDQIGRLAKINTEFLTESNKK